MQTRTETSNLPSLLSIQFLQPPAPVKPAASTTSKPARATQRPWGAPLPIPSGQAPQQARHVSHVTCQLSASDARPSLLGDAITCTAPLSPRRDPDGTLELDPLSAADVFLEFGDTLRVMLGEERPADGGGMAHRQSMGAGALQGGDRMSPHGPPCDPAVQSLSLRDADHDGEEIRMGSGTPLGSSSRPPTPVRLAMLASPSPGPSKARAPGPYNFTGARCASRRATAPDGPGPPRAPSPGLARIANLISSLYMRGSLGRQSPITDPLGACPAGNSSRQNHPRQNARHNIPAFRNMERRFTVPAQNDAMSWCLDSLPSPASASTRRQPPDAPTLSRPPSARNGAQAPPPPLDCPPASNGRGSSGFARVTPTLDGTWPHPSPPTPPPGQLPAAGIDPATPGGSSQPCGPVFVANRDGEGSVGLTPPRRRNGWREGEGDGAQTPVRGSGPTAGPSLEQTLWAEEFRLRSEAHTPARTKDRRASLRPQVPRAARISEETRTKNAEAKRAEAEHRAQAEQRRRLDAILLEGPLTGWECPDDDPAHAVGWEAPPKEGKERRVRRGSKGETGGHPPLLPLARRRQKHGVLACSDE